MAGADDKQQLEAMRAVLTTLKRVRLDSTPPEIGDQVHRIVRERVGDGDPYLEVKRKSTEEALSFYPRLKALLGQAPDPLELAVRMSIAGNIIDLGPGHAFDLMTEVGRVLEQPFALDAGDALRVALEGADWVLYLADNAGETVFDRLLVETLPLPVVYAVKGGRPSTTPPSMTRWLPA